MRNYLFLLLALPSLHAQPVLTPTPDASSTASDIGAYKVTNSVETGYRFTTIGGDKSLFRSVENYGNGIRLFGANFDMRAKDGHGHLFDAATLTTSGLGNDPYGFANLTVDKKDRYRYDMTWRRNDYYNQSLLNGAGAGFKNTRRVMQDHDLHIAAKPWAKLILGYTRNHETGPEFTNYETYIGGLARSGLPLARDTHRDFNEYRLGAELDFLGFRLNLAHRWENYKDDSAIASLFPGQPYAADIFRQHPFDPTLEATYPQAANAYSRSQPMHTRRNGWFVTLSRSEKIWATNASLAYSKGNTQSVYSERMTGAAQAAGTNIPTGDGRFLNGSNSGFGAQINAATYMPGAARQPFLSGDFSFSVFPTTKLTVTATTSVLSNRYDGTGNELRVLSNTNAVINRFYTFHIGTGRVSSALDLNYRVNNWLGLHSEYRYTSRFIDNFLVRTGTTNSRDFNSTRNHLNTGTFGVRLKPMRALSVNVDTTVGRDNGPLNPTSPANFHNIRARVDYRAKRLKLGGTYRQLYNLNAPYAGPSLDYFASHSRDISGTASFQAKRYLSFDANYTRAHMDSLANIFALLVPQGSTTINTVSARGYQSQFISNLQTVSLMVRATVRRGTFYTGYNISRDTGDGRNQQALGLTNLAGAYTAAWSTFPMTYQSPMARLSIKLTPKTQWNFGWQLYRYHQQFAYFGYQPYYRAHTGYTSISYTFGDAPSQPEPKSPNKDPKP